MIGRNLTGLARHLTKLGNSGAAHTLYSNIIPMEAVTL